MRHYPIGFVFLRITPPLFYVSQVKSKGCFWPSVRRQCLMLSRLRPDRDFVAVRIAEVKSAAAFERFARHDLGARCAYMRFHGIKIVRVEHHEWPAFLHNFALRIEAALPSVARFEGDVVRSVVCEGPAEQRGIELFRGQN